MKKLCMLLVLSPMLMRGMAPASESPLSNEVAVAQAVAQVSKDVPVAPAPSEGPAAAAPAPSTEQPAPAEQAAPDAQTCANKKSRCALI